MKTLMERVTGFTQTRPAQVKRNGQSYAATYRVCYDDLERLIGEYKRLEVYDQTARLTKDKMDNALRRYQNYSIKENIGAHYYEKGLPHNAKTEFEHVIPAGVARDLLLHDRLTINEALNIPTCRLSAEKHKKLNSTKLGSTTPDIYWFWRRYQELGIEVETHDGTAVNMADWNLDTHYQYFS